MVGIATSQRLAAGNESPATCCRRMIPGLLVYYPSGLQLREEEGEKLLRCRCQREAERLRAWFAHQPVTPSEAEDVAISLAARLTTATPA